MENMNYIIEFNTPTDNGLKQLAKEIVQITNETHVVEIKTGT